MGQQFRVLREQNGLSIDETAELLGVRPKTIRRWETGEVEPRRAFYTVLEDRIAQRKAGQMANGDFTFVDLFAGIGGMRRGFESAGGNCVFTSEWDPYAQRTYRANFPDDHIIYGDITTLDESRVPDHDVLLAGFPCQPFSVAGVSKKNALGHKHGFLDKTQGTLFFDVLRILKKKQPAAFLLENVKNLRGHDGGKTFEVIKGALEDDLRYHISVRIIDAKGYVPQHRERIFIAGFRKDTGFRFEDLDFASPLNGPTLESILHAADERPEEPYTQTQQKGDRSRTVVNDKYTLTDKLWTYLQDYARKHQAQGNGFGFGLNTAGDRARTLSARYYKDGSEILIAQKGKNPRRLTPRECARLMGFDDGRDRCTIIPVSDTRAYKQFGNAVVVPVVSEIARHMKPHILKLKSPAKTRTKRAGQSRPRKAA